MAQLTDPCVTVITPSLPERNQYRSDCIASVQSQLPSLDGYPSVADHLIGIDYRRTGVTATLNRLWPAVETEWTLVLADDDLLDPDFLNTVLTHASWGTASDGRLGTRGYDIYYTYCRVVGFNHPASLNQPFDEAKLRGANYIPATALIRTSLIRELEGWRDHPQGPGLEDWDFWLRALDLGVRFKCVQRVKWTYRFHGDNLSLIPPEQRKAA